MASRKSPIPDEVFHKLFHLGFVEVETWQLYSWFDKSRLTDKDWLRLQEGWEIYCELDSGDSPEYILRFFSNFQRVLFITESTFEVFEKAKRALED